MSNTGITVWSTHTIQAQSVAQSLNKAIIFTKLQIAQSLKRERDLRNSIYEQTYIRRVLFEKHEHHSFINSISTKLSLTNLRFYE